ncbi:MAG TPA: transcriptional regulator NrdR [bacterium]|jgi:transcriptional repressor NrdR|nr:transcriptional regulator NrdR [bacterium]
MRCPFCSSLEDKVVDSRSSKNGDAIRRRRECLRCAKRYTTYEQLEDIQPMVVKKDGRRQAFDRLKLLSGLRKACEKRPISQETLDGLVDDLHRELELAFDKEFPSTAIGELVMKKLYILDEVAYVRFASVYRQFKDVQAFSDELKRYMSRFDDPETNKGPKG